MSDQAQNPTETQLYSHHVFLFPFKWLRKDSAEKTLEVQTDLKEFANELDGSNQWTEEAFKIDTIVHYNEYNYFYDFVRDVLYDMKGKENDISSSNQKDSNTENMIRHYRYQGNEKYYTILAPDPEDKKKKKCYTLDVDCVLLHIYSTGVGILSFHLKNFDATSHSPKDILWINQYGRRLYPPFFNIPHSIAGTDQVYQYKRFKDNLPVGTEIAHAICFTENKLTAREVIEHKNRIWEKYYETYGGIGHDLDVQFGHSPFLIPPFLEKILPHDYFSEDGSKSKFKLTPILDDRMFVICWYGNDLLAKQLSGNSSEDQVSIDYRKHDWWYKYVYVDTVSKTCQNDDLQYELIDEATNARWKNFGTLYGVTDYSFVLLTSELLTLRKDDVNASFLVTHLQTLYYKLVELTLLQKASVLRFSDEITRISAFPSSETRMIRDRINSLFKEYIRFVNKMYFREVTSQTQGEELYQLLQKQNRLEKHVKDLDGEINELHSYVQYTVEEDRLKQEEVITTLGAVILLPSIVIGMHSLGYLPEINTSCNQCLYLILTILLAFVGFFSYKAFGNGKGYWKWLLILVLSISILLPLAISMVPICK